MNGTPFFVQKSNKERINMKEKSQKEKLESMMKRPIPKKKVGIVRLEMVRESRCLYGTRKFRKPEEAAEMIRPLLKAADREMLVVLALNNQMEPQALEIAAVGGLNHCYIEPREIYKLAILNNAAAIICFHNHPSGDCKPSKEDRLITDRLKKAGEILGITLIDHLIIGEDSFYSLREKEQLEFPETIAA